MIICCAARVPEVGHKTAPNRPQAGIMTHTSLSNYHKITGGHPAINHDGSEIENYTALYFSIDMYWRINHQSDRLISSRMHPGPARCSSQVRNSSCGHAAAPSDRSARPGNPSGKGSNDRFVISNPITQR
jgi:hypothetical protein